MEELRALLSLAENQLFRVKYIDPKMPGYRAQPNQLRAGESAVQILQVYGRGSCAGTARGCGEHNAGRTGYSTPRGGAGAHRASLLGYLSLDQVVKRTLPKLSRR